MPTVVEKNASANDSKAANFSQGMLCDAIPSQGHFDRYNAPRLLLFVPHFCCGSSASKSAILGAALGFIMPTT